MRSYLHEPILCQPETNLSFVASTEIMVIRLKLHPVEKGNQKIDSGRIFEGIYLWCPTGENKGDADYPRSFIY